MKTATLIDLDRTIFNTTKFWDEVFGAVEQIYGVEKRVECKSICDQIYSESGIAPIGLVCDRANVDITKILDRLTGDYLYDDARGFMDSCRHPIILSMGDEFTQKVKMYFARVDLPTIIVEKHDKARWVGKNCLRDGGYEILGQRFDAIELYDDKIPNFVGFEKLPNARGFLIRRGAVGDISGLPDNVVIIHDLCNT